MKPFGTVAAAIILGVVCLLMRPARSAPQVKVVTQEEAKHYQWLLERLEETQSLRAGMTRADLLKVFEPDGGLQRIPPERYVLRSCYLIKVHVEFEFPKGTSRTNLPPDTELKISAISKAYLEPMTMD